jgi:hypothetical protein
VELAPGYVGELVQAAVGAHRRMMESAARLTDADCRYPRRPALDPAPAAPMGVTARPQPIIR